MKQIKCTHIDTASHGYYSVSKQDIKRLGLEPAQITGYSGHTFNRVYLEEDQDGTLLFEMAKKNGYELKVKRGYNPKFKIIGNYNPLLFDYLPSEGDKIEIFDRPGFTVSEVGKNLVVVKDQKGKHWKVPASNPFKYITAAIITD